MVKRVHRPKPVLGFKLSKNQKVLEQNAMLNAKIKKALDKLAPRNKPLADHKRVLSNASSVLVRSGLALEDPTLFQSTRRKKGKGKK
jgi:hypothetical protein